MRTKIIIKDQHKGKKSIKHPFFYSTLTKKKNVLFIFFLQLNYRSKVLTNAGFTFLCHDSA